MGKCGTEGNLERVLPKIRDTFYGRASLPRAPFHSRGSLCDFGLRLAAKLIATPGVSSTRMRTIAVIVAMLSCAIALAQWDAEYLRRNPPPPWSSVEQMHAVYVEKFIQSSGFGVGRMTHDLRNHSELV